jgi:hypothetical protein
MPVKLSSFYALYWCSWHSLSASQAALASQADLFMARVFVGRILYSNSVLEMHCR